MLIFSVNNSKNKTIWSKEGSETIQPIGKKTRKRRRRPRKKGKGKANGKDTQNNSNNRNNSDNCKRVNETK